MTGIVCLIPRGLLLVALALLLTSVGCANPTRQSAPPPGSAASSTIVETPLAACTSVTRDDGLSLSQGWADVVTSKDASDRQRRVERFADDTQKVADARYDDACADIKPMIVQLASEASRLSAWMLIGDGEADLTRYQAVAEAGNILMKRLGVDQQFDTPGLTGT